VQEFHGLGRLSVAARQLCIEVYCMMLALFLVGFEFSASAAWLRILVIRPDPGPGGGAEKFPRAIACAAPVGS
jgi:hypothetical protein